MMKNYLLLVLAVFALSLMAPPVFAASLFFESAGQSFAQGDEFLVNVYLDTQGESVNATEGKIMFPANLLELKEIRAGNSAINFWVEEPKLEQPGTVGFSGVIPGGYQQAKGFLFSAVLKTKSPGSGVVQTSGAKVLLNDGQGTQASLTTHPFQFSISKSGGAIHPLVQPIKDTEPPENFTPEITSDSSLFAGQWFLVFATQDKGSGIDHYEVCEQSKTNCVIAKSPYPLKDQKLSSFIYVKVFDKAGNERIVSLSPRYPAAWYKNYLIWIIIIFATLLAIVAGHLIKKLFRIKYNKK
jgi:hypothetical protein